jgi:hypothetical protein
MIARWPNFSEGEACKIENQVLTWKFTSNLKGYELFFISSAF